MVWLSVVVANTCWHILPSSSWPKVTNLSLKFWRYICRSSRDKYFRFVGPYHYFRLSVVVAITFRQFFQLPMVVNLPLEFQCYLLQFKRCKHFAFPVSSTISGCRWLIKWPTNTFFYLYVVENPGWPLECWWYLSYFWRYKYVLLVWMATSLFTVDIRRRSHCFKLAMVDSPGLQ